jgi:hypothetical protein
MASGEGWHGDEVKNELVGGQMPSQRFGVNGAWFKLALLAYPDH